MRKTTKKTPTFNVGDKVRLSAKYLQSTGQYSGREAHAKWTVVEVGDHDMVYVDEPRHDLSYWTPEELKAMEVTYGGRTFVPRAINANNLKLVGKPDYSGL